MSAVSVVIIYGQNNLDRFNMMAEYWRRAMLPEELKKAFFISAADKHLSISDPRTADRFREQCWKLKRPDEISPRLIEKMLSMVSVEGIHLHIICGGDSAWDPMAPLRLIERLRSKVMPVVVTPHIYMMAEESARAQQQQRVCAQALQDKLNGFCLYLLSRRDENGKLLSHFDMGRALTCEILLRMRGARRIHYAGKHIYTLGYKSLNAFDGELEVLRSLALRDAAQEQHREALHNVDAWRMVFPSGAEWKRYFVLSEDWRGRYEPQKRCDNNQEAWHSALPETEAWERLGAVEAPDMGNTADVQEKVRTYLTWIASDWVKRCNDMQLENMRVLAGLKGQETSATMMNSVHNFYRANMSDDMLKRRIDVFCTLLVSQFTMRLCETINATKFQDGVLNAVIAALDKLAAEVLPRPGVMEPKVSVLDKVKHRMDGWKKYLQQLSADANLEYHKYRVQLAVKEIAEELKSRLRTDAVVFLQQLRKSDDFSRATSAVLGESTINEEELKSKYSGYWADVEGTLNSRQNLMGWPFGSYAGTNDSGRGLSVYDRSAVWRMVDYAKQAAAGLPVNGMEQEHNLDAATDHLTEFLREIIAKEGQKLHDEQSVAYSGSFIKTLREMNPLESDMDGFLNRYLEGGSRMLCMIYCSKSPAEECKYFVDRGLARCDWVKNHEEELLSVQNDNIERVDLYKLQEPLTELLKMDANKVFGSEEDLDEATAEMLRRQDVTIDSDDDDDADEQWRMEADNEPEKPERDPGANRGGRVDGTEMSQVKSIIHRQTGAAEMIYWPAPTEVQCGPATICVSDGPDSLNSVRMSVNGVAECDIAGAVRPGRNFVQVRYHGEVYAEAWIRAKLQTRKFAFKMTDKGRMLLFNAPGDSFFVLRDGHVRYPIGRAEGGLFGPLRLQNADSATVEEFAQNPKYQLKRDDNM